MLRRLALCVALTFVTLGIGPASPSRQPMVLIPTHQWDFQTAGSVVPQRGGTTGTFTRATVTSRIASGAYTTVGSGTAVITQVLVAGGTLPSSTAPSGVFLGEATVFELVNNTAISGPSWGDTGTPITTADTQNDPFGAATCDNVNDDAAGVLEYRSQGVTIANDSGVWQASVWVRCASSHSISLQLALTGGTPVTTTTTVTCRSFLQKVVAQATNNATGNVTAGVRLLPTTVTPADVGNADFCYPQLYKEPFESIREESVSVSSFTVNAENLTFSSVAPGSGTMCFWLWAERDDTETNIFSWDGATADWQLGMVQTGTIDIDITGSGVAKITTNETVAEKAWTHVCSVWTDGTQLDIFLDGTEATYASTDETWTAGGDYGTTLALGQGPGAAIQGAFVISRAKLWAGRTLNAGQINSLYNRERGKYGL